MNFLTNNTRHKVFVSYKHGDKEVYPLPIDLFGPYTPGKEYTDRYTARGYVNEFERIAGDIMIYKGEEDGEDLSCFSNDTIWNELKEKIFDSSLTVVFISPKMRKNDELEEQQWIPQEVRFSLRRSTRDGRTSQPNALLCVALPDGNDDYRYVSTMKHFGIIQRNRDNEYATFVFWTDFIKSPKHYIDLAYKQKEGRTPDARIYTPEEKLQDTLRSWVKQFSSY